mmetsp:Transcript_8210/g.13011  ORF Transcript_8210/g.13011 Transcript_8210/m.13011 type:complete len:254 (+) Transcript_8210:18-779(+)
MDLNTTVRFPGAKGAFQGKYSRSQSTDPDVTPGPGEYEVAPKRLKGGRFSNADRTSAVDQMQRTAASMPGPGEYSAYDMLKKRGGKLPPRDGKRSKSSIEWEVYGKRHHPGPGEYEIKQPRKKTTNFGAVSNESALEKLTRHAALTPGPGEYNPESDSIQARIRHLVRKEYSTKSRLKIEQMKIARRDYAESMSETGKTLGQPLFGVAGIIRKLWGTRPGSPPKELPSTEELCIELRAAGSIRRSYKETGVQL